MRRKGNSEIEEIEIGDRPRFSNNVSLESVIAREKRGLSPIPPEQEKHAGENGDQEIRSHHPQACHVQGSQDQVTGFPAILNNQPRQRRGFVFYGPRMNANTQ